jgi:RNA polymerase sigma factor (sigma-70 family)
MLSDAHDAETLARSVNEPDHFAVFYRAHAATILRYLRGRLSPDLAEDATHEVFLRAFRQRASYEPRFPTARPWLYGIAANLVADHHRNEARRLRALERESVAAGHQAQPRFATDTPDLSPELAAALRRLTLGDREALLLTVWGELSYEETAAALDIAIGTVRSRIARARAFLRAELAGTQKQHPNPKGGLRV